MLLDGSDTDAVQERQRGAELVDRVGTTIFRFFGISLPVTQVSGGLVLAAMGWHLLNQSDPPPTPGTLAADGPDISDGAIAFVLLCIGVQITWNGIAALLTIGNIRAVPG